MQVEVSGKHISLGDSLQQYVKNRSNFFEGAEHEKGISSQVS